MTEACYFEQYICKYLPLNQVIGKEETIQWTIIPSKQITSRILVNNARIQHVFFLSFFIILEVILIWISIPPLIQNHLPPFLIFFLFLVALSACVIVYLLHSLMQLNESALPALEWYSEYALTNKKLYLKMTRVFFTKKSQPVSCRIRIVDLRIIRTVKLYKSFWDRRYKETASFKIRMISPYPAITLHNLPNPENFMATISNALNSIHSKNGLPNT
jgi:hypothetical protein